jgi:DNA adenine methylase
LSCSQPIKRHGGKAYLAQQIVAMFPSRCLNPNAPDPADSGYLHYVEPYFGGGAVLFANDPVGISEVVCDLDGELTNFWDAIKSVEKFQELAWLAALTPVSWHEYERAVTPKGTPAERALAFLVRNRQSRQALGKDFCTVVKNRCRRGMQEQVSAWLSAVDGLPEIHARLKRVMILPSGDGIATIKQQDGPRTLFYLDPPYLHSTRTEPDCYDHEMTGAQHRELLKTLAGIQGRFVLSGYHSPLYDTFADTEGWRVREFEIDNKSGSGATKQRRVEVIWTDYDPPQSELY